MSQLPRFLENNLKTTIPNTYENRLPIVYSLFIRSILNVIAYCVCFALNFADGLAANLKTIAAYLRNFKEVHIIKVVVSHQVVKTNWIIKRCKKQMILKVVPSECETNLSSQFISTRRLKFSIKWSSKICVLTLMIRVVLS